MTTAEWKNQKWGANKNLLRGIESLSISCEAKTVTDSANNTTKCQGRTLEKLTVSFSTAIAAGGNPSQEQKQLEKLAGTSAPFYCGEEQIGDNDFILEAVGMKEGLLSNQGKILKARFDLSFIEDAKEQELNGAEKNEKELKITFQGENVARRISIKKIFYTEYAENHADVLELHFNDTGKNWDRWDGGKINGQEIEIEYGTIKSGKMYITACAPQGGVFVLRALSVPASYNTTHTKSWEKITLEELAKEIAGNHGLGCKTFDTKNKKRKFIQQDNEGDFEFLQKRCLLEGACFVVYNGNLNLYDEKAMETKSPGAKINLDAAKFTTCSPVDTTDQKTKEYTVKNGRFVGTATDSEGTKTKTEMLDEPLEDDTEAKEIATAKLRAANKGARSMTIDTDLRPEISAGSVVNLETDQKKTWAGAAFVCKLRHDLAANKTKLWVRKPLEY